MIDNISIMAKKILKVGFLIFCVALILGSLGVLTYVRQVQNSSDYVKFDKSRLTEVCSTLKILDDNGEEIDQALCFENNKQIPLSALHDYTYKAFVAVEDKRFFNHNGLDAKRILGAVFHNAKSGRFKEGASTISQQLIKNTHLDNSKNLKRKVNEMLLALELEKNYTKEEILETYLNTIYFGRNAYGIESAANVYFDKSARDLTVSESAILAGMIKAPNNYAPDKNSEKCRARRNLVLKLMLEQGVIAQDQFDEAINSEIVYKEYHAVTEKNYVSQAIDEACKVLNMTPTQLLHSDFIIETYFEKNVQNALDLAVANDNTQNANGSLTDLSCVICKNDGGISACYFRGESALRSKQIGSTAKPIAVYTPALCEKLITQASPVLDEPTNFGGYVPTNASGYNGWTTIKTAVTKSLNVPAVKTLNTLGLKKAQQYLEKLGFSGEQNLSLALGNISGGMTATQLANCYATLANGGTNNGISYVKRISNEHGDLYTRKQANVRVYDEKASFLMTDMLQNAVNKGTAKQLKTTEIAIAAKTGTVGTEKGNSQALVAGYTTEHTFVFWYSGDLENSVNGGTAPCKLAKQVLTKMYDETPKDFEMPKGIVKLAVDKDALYQNQQIKLAEKGENFLFETGNKPKEKITMPSSKHNERLSVTETDGKFVLTLPKVDGASWQIMQKQQYGDAEYTGDFAENGVYYARLIENGKCIYTTPEITITAPQDKSETNPWHFWVLPFFNN